MLEIFDDCVVIFVNFWCKYYNSDLNIIGKIFLVMVGEIDYVYCIVGVVDDLFSLFYMFKVSDVEVWFLLSVDCCFFYNDDW